MSQPRRNFIASRFIDGEPSQNDFDLLRRCAQSLDRRAGASIHEESIGVETIVLNGVEMTALVLRGYEA